MRAPYTDQWVCRLHKRLGSHADEATCPAYLFTPVDEVPPDDAEIAAQIDAAKKGATKRFRKRPEPAEVTATAFGALMLVNAGVGPEFPVPRDQFFATYEEIEEAREDLPPALPEDAGDAATTEPLEPSS